MAIRARVYGNTERMGAIKKFEIVEELPEEGERVTWVDPGTVWGKAEKVRLDPEQRTGDDDRHSRYSFWVVPEIDTEDGGEFCRRYFALMDDEIPVLWYAVVTDDPRENGDWGDGSRDLDEAKRMAEEYGDGYYIAVIDDHTDPVCVDEIRRDDGEWEA